MTRASKNLFRRFQWDFESILQGPRPVKRLLTVLIGAVAGWFVFVPAHELLHAAGCVLGGGQVTRLDIAPQYGGGLLAKLFPFVAAGGDYAGRLSGFDTGGSGLTYALTILAPYILAPLGFFLMKAAVSQGHPALFGASTPLALSPLLAIPGDFLELAGLALYQFWPGPANLHRGLISDDILRLVEDPNTPNAIPFVAASQLLAIALAWLALRLSAAARGK